MSEKFNLEESAALLQDIFPHYPDVTSGKPMPNLGEFLREYRATQAGNEPLHIAKACTQ
jgi:hypothetical protein